MKRTIALLLSALAFGTAQAAVIDNADVNGLRTFRDTNTGRVWLDLNNFFNRNVTQMLAVANAAGFTFAMTDDVQELLNTLGLGGEEWFGYNVVMGGAPNRHIIWGAYDDGFDPNRVGWAWADGTMVAWDIFDNAWDITNVPNGGTGSADMNLWAFQTGQVPEPASLALIGLGLAGLGFMRRK